MYHPDIVAERLQQVLTSPAGALYPGGVERLSVDTCRGFTRQLAQAWDPQKGQPTRSLSSEEQAFIANERLLTKLDYAYWAERYATIIHPAKGVSPMYPLWESQRLILTALGEQELARRQSGHPDGLIFNVLKGRQLGCSTLCQSILAHRATTQSYTKGMIGSDVPENSGSTGLFGLFELTVEHLPWWLKPGERFHQKDQHIVFTNHSSIVVESGKSMKGAKQDDGGQKGQLGRSKTYSVVHLSELSTWENPETIDDALSPAVAQTPRTFWAKESTAKGRHNWWHREWLATERGLGRSFNIFIPWYAERSKYWLPVPEGWEPPGYCLEYAERVAEYGPRWMRRSFRLSPEQLYWYYSQREAAEEKDALYKFLEEYPAEPGEAFQYSGRGIFSPAAIDRLRNQMQPVRALYRVQPNVLIAEIRDELYATQQAERALKMPETQEAEVPRLTGPSRGLPPLPRKLVHLTDNTTYIPPGYGFRTLREGELFEAAKAGELLDVFQVWEPPLRGARYILGVDVSEGLGQDRSVVDVIRMGTLQRPEGQVAQYISDAVKPAELAGVIDAIGHYYCDDDGLEALAAIETNNCGLSTQDTLQLHLGYRHFYRWEVLDSIDPSTRFTKKVGWYTTPKSRPILLDYLHEALTTVDPLTGLTDLRVNSLWTLEDLADFQTQTTLREAEAAAGAHDDCVMALAIGHIVAWRLAGGEIEPLADRRRRRHLMEERARRISADGETARDFRNMAYSEQEAEAWSDRREAGDPDRDEDELEAIHDTGDPRGIIYDDEYSGY